MKSSIVHSVFVASWIVSLALTSACSDPGTDPQGEGVVTLNLTRNGKPVAGMQVVLQNESDSTEIGSGVSDAQGKIVTTPFEGTARATFIDESSPTETFLYTVREIKTAASLQISIPENAPSPSVGTIQFATPSLVTGADRYVVYLMGSTTAQGNLITLPLTPGAPLAMGVTADALLANGKVTLVVVAKQLVPNTTSYKPIAYSILRDVPVSPTGTAPLTTSTFGAWKADMTNVTAQISALPAGFAVDSVFARIYQFNQSTALSASIFSVPTSFSTPPLKIDMSLVAGIADRFGTELHIGDTVNGYFALTVSRSQVLPSVVAWDPTKNGLPLLSSPHLDPTSLAAAPRLTWTQSGLPTTSADAALIQLLWSVGDKTFYWYSITSVESVVDSGAYQFPELPAAYGAYLPQSGTPFESSLAAYLDYSADAGYDAFLSNNNLNAATTSIATGQTAVLNMAGVLASP